MKSSLDLSPNKGQRCLPKAPLETLVEPGGRPQRYCWRALVCVLVCAAAGGNGTGLPGRNGLLRCGAISQIAVSCHVIGGCSRLSGRVPGANSPLYRYLQALLGSLRQVSLIAGQHSTAHLRRQHTSTMPHAEWRLFLPNENSRRAPAEARALIALVDHEPPVLRTDVYLKADADVGVKLRVSGVRTVLTACKSSSCELLWPMPYV